MLKKNDVIFLKIESATHDGSGVGKVDNFAVFVPGTTAGDQIEARIVKVNKSYAFGRMEKLIVPSEYRVKSPCPVFSMCGGCVFMNISYQAELAMKQERVQQALRKIGGFTDFKVENILPSPQEYHYRNKAQFPVGIANGGAAMGFYAPRSHRITDIETCLIQSPAINQAQMVFREFINQYHISIYNGTDGLVRHFYVRCAKDGGYMAVVVVNGKKLPFAEKLISMLQEKTDGLKALILNVNTKTNNVVLGERCITLYGNGYLEDTMCGVLFRLSPLSFYQVNREQAERLYLLIGELAQLTGNETVIDLYCGAGTIGMTLAKKAKEIIGVEAVAPAVEDAKFNAQQNEIENIRFLCADAGEAANQLLEEGVRPDVIVVDPPRKGCDYETLYAIEKLAPQRVIYMSCDCETMARDVKILSGNGFQFIRCFPADMFPKTGHVECVVLMSRVEK